MGIYHDQAIFAEIAYRQEQARRSWPAPRRERHGLRRRVQRVLRALRRSRSAARRHRTTTSHLVLGCSAQLVGQRDSQQVPVRG